MYRRSCFANLKISSGWPLSLYLEKSNQSYLQSATCHHLLSVHIPVYNQAPLSPYLFHQSVLSASPSLSCVSSGNLMLRPASPTTLPVAVASPSKGGNVIAASSLGVGSSELAPAFSSSLLPTGDAILGVPCLLTLLLSDLDTSADLFLGTKLRPIL